MEDKNFKLKDLLSDMAEHGGSYVDFLHTRNLDAGIIRLDENEKDTQEPHSTDELYYVIHGSGMIEINNRDQAISEGSVIFVPAKAKHRFHKISQTLVILYVFGK